MLGIASLGRAESRPNPYTAIVERNPFGLKEPPVAPPVETVKPVTPPAKVVLTGITSLSSAKKCFLEITEQEAGKSGTVLRPILQEGEGAGSVEVVSIDVEKNTVRIKNSGQELDLKFEDPTKLASAAPRAGVPMHPAVPPAPAFHPPPQLNTGGPTIISPSSSENSSRNSSVSMFGSQPTAGVDPASQVNGAIPSALGRTEGGTVIPPRPVRTQSQGAVDPAAQYANTLIQTKVYEKKGFPMPPMPPVPGEPAQSPPVPGQ